MGDWRRLHNVERRTLHASPNIEGDEIKEDEMDGTCSAHV
jgi:hypothetical protein